VSCEKDKDTRKKGVRKKEKKSCKERQGDKEKKKAIKKKKKNPNLTATKRKRCQKKKSAKGSGGKQRGIAWHAKKTSVPDSKKVLESAKKGKRGGGDHRQDQTYLPGAF